MFILLIKKYLFDGIEKTIIVEELLKKIDSEEIYKLDDFIISDCFFAIKHITEDKFETSNEELKYFLECFEEGRKYDIEEKNDLINNR